MRPGCPVAGAVMSSCVFADGRWALWLLSPEHGWHAGLGMTALAVWVVRC